MLFQDIFVLFAVFMTIFWHRPSPVPAILLPPFSVRQTGRPFTVFRLQKTVCSTHTQPLPKKAKKELTSANQSAMVMKQFDIGS